MTATPVPALPSEGTPESVPASRPLRLRIARAAWLAWVVLVVSLFVASLPANFEELHRACDPPDCAENQLTRNEFGLLQAAGVAVDGYAVYMVILLSVFSAVHAAIGLFIFLRKPADPLALFVAFTLVTFGVVTYAGSLDLFAAKHPAWWFPVMLISFVGSVSLLAFLYIFPSGHFVPRWTRWLTAVWIAREGLRYFLPESPISPAAWPSPLADLLFVVPIGAGLFAQVYRYRQVSGSSQRQQTKWVVYGVAVGLGGLIGLALLLSSFPGLQQDLAIMWAAKTAFPSLLLLIPLSIGVAMLRSRLWDIDLIISRTLVYVPLSASLAGLYAGSTTFLQRAFIAATGQSSDAALVLTVVILATAFTPIKNGLQTVVDRRFREPADPLASLKVFQGQVRSVGALIDIEQVLGRLLDEATGALGASSAGVYLIRGGEPHLVKSSPGWTVDHSAQVVPLRSRGHEIGALHLGESSTGEPYPHELVGFLQQTANEVARLVDVIQGFS